MGVLEPRIAGAERRSRCRPSPCPPRPAWNSSRSKPKTCNGLGGTKGQDLYVHDLDPRQNRPSTISATTMFYDFRDGYSSTIAVLCLVDDDRVVSITLADPGKLDITAVVANRTFILAGPTLTGNSGDTARITTLDLSGMVLQQHSLRTLL